VQKINKKMYEYPERLNGKPEECTPEQIKKYQRTSRPIFKKHFPPIISK